MCREADSFAERFFEENAPNPHLDSLSRNQTHMIENEVAMVKLLSLESLLLASLDGVDSAAPERKEKIMRQLRGYRTFLDAENPYQLAAKDIHPVILEELNQTLM